MIMGEIFSNCKHGVNKNQAFCSDCYLEESNYHGYDKTTYNVAYNILKKEADENHMIAIVSKWCFNEDSSFKKYYNKAKIKLRIQKIKSIL